MRQIDLLEPHSPGQWELTAPSYTDVVFAGRRWGKTQAGIYKILRGATEDPGLYWWIGLSWKSASMKRAWRLLKYISRQIIREAGGSPERQINETNKEIRLTEDIEIWLRSAENEDSLAGEGIKGAVLDEFSLMKESVWTEYVQATLLDNEGWALFIGVPKGNNWAAYLWRDAPNRSGWRQYHFTSYDNPFINPAKIDEIKSQVSERIFSQEYLAQIVSDEGAVFRGIMEAATSEQRNGEGDYVFGVDWGKHQDFTVISVMDINTGEQVYLDRFNQIDYVVQLGRLRALYEQYKPQTIIAESNAMGEPLIEQLQRDGLPVQPFKTTNQSKAQAIESLALAFESKEIKILPDPIQLGELQSYEMERLPSGLIRYNAPAGMHDDTVIALSLNWQAVQNAGWILWGA